MCVCVCVMRPRSRTRTRKGTETEREGNDASPIEAHSVLIKEKKEKMKRRSPRTDRRLDGSRARMFVGRSRGVESTRKKGGKGSQTIASLFDEARRGAYILVPGEIMYATRSKQAS